MSPKSLRKTMEARVSSLESKFDDVKNSQDEIKSTLAQLQSMMARFAGGSIGESSEATMGDPQFQNPMNPNSCSSRNWA